jgi:hypothetical protein
MMASMTAWVRVERAGSAVEASACFGGVSHDGVHAALGRMVLEEGWDVK